MTCATTCSDNARRWVRTVGGILAAAALLAVAKAAPPVPEADSGDPAVIAILEPILREHSMPALAAAIVTDRGPVAIGAVGVRKAGTDIPVTVGDLWHLGSETKAMTAALAATLVEEGRLGWDSTIGEVLPAAELPPESRAVTLTELLSHHAGLAPNLDWRRLSRRGSVREQRQRAVRDALRKPPNRDPDGMPAYANTGYVVAGAMIEAVLDTPWEDAVTQRVFLPLRMTGTGFGGVGTPGVVDQPWGHGDEGKPVKRNGPEVDNPPVLGPAGRVHCSLEDWARFVADQLRGARGHDGLLKAETYRRIHAANGKGNQAFGWGIADRVWGGGQVLNHTGSNTMNYANAWLAPEKNFAILVCTNRGGDAAFKATDAAVAALIPMATAAGEKATGEDPEAAEDLHPPAR